MTARILIGDCRLRMAELPDASVDSVVCDPPYHLTSIVKRFRAENAAPAKVGKTGAYARASKGFMGQTWDGGDVAFQSETWAEVLRVLKPGGHLVAFSGTRTYHRMVCAIEDAGFEIRDQLAWIYGSGFPKSHDVSKVIDKLAGHARGTNLDTRNGPNTNNASKGDKFSGGYDGQNVVDLGPVTEAAQQWQGWGTALKPSWEPICLARKPLIGTVARNVLAHGTGAINIDGCRIDVDDGEPNKRAATGAGGGGESIFGVGNKTHTGTLTQGRWPANLCHDGSDEVLAGFPDSDGQLFATGPQHRPKTGTAVYGDYGPRPAVEPRGDSGSAARFFYCAKTTTEERGEGNNHPTVKPVALMRWLVRLITPPGGTVLDPFMGSGSTLIAADAEQFHAIGCELSPDYAAIAERRITDAAGLFADVASDDGEQTEAAA